MGDNGWEDPGYKPKCGFYHQQQRFEKWIMDIVCVCPKMRCTLQMAILRLEILVENSCINHQVRASWFITTVLLEMGWIHHN